MKFTSQDFVDFCVAQYGLSVKQAQNLFDQWAIILRYVDRYSDKNVNVKNAMISHVNSVMRDSALMRSLKVTSETDGLSFVRLVTPALFDLLYKKKDSILPALDSALKDLRDRKVRIVYVEVDVTLNSDKYASQRFIDLMDANGQSISRSWTSLSNWTSKKWDAFSDTVGNITDSAMVNVGLKDAPKTVTQGSFGGSDETPAQSESRTLSVDDDAFSGIQVRAGAAPVKQTSNKEFPLEPINDSQRGSDDYSSPNYEDPIFKFISN